MQPDAILVARGAVDRRGGGDEANLIVNELLRLDQLESRYTHGVLIRVQEDKHGMSGLESLKEILRGYPGHCELQLQLNLTSGQRVRLKTEKMRIDVIPEMRNRVDDLLGRGNLRLLTTNSSDGRK